MYKNPDEGITKDTVVTELTSDYLEITDVKQAMDLILSQPGLMLNGEMLSGDSKIALANAIQMGLAYAEKRKK